jgi:hypothetical protein
MAELSKSFPYQFGRSSDPSRPAWLVPIYTADASKAATSFDVLIQPFSDPKLSDLAQGAGRDFRYIIPRAARNLSEKVTEVAMFKSEKPISRPPTGWQGYCINDLYKGRKKDHLYIVWKTVPTNSWYVSCLV